MVEHQVDAGAYAWPHPVANSATGLSLSSESILHCPFKYRSFQEWLTSALIHSMVSVRSTIAMQNDGGANCFIFNDAQAFWSITYTSLSVRQLDGSQILAQGYSAVVIQPPKSIHMLALWPSYYYPSAQQNTCSPNDFKHYLHLPSVITEHTKHLSLTLHSSVVLQFLSLPDISPSSGIDFFNVNIVKPTSPSIYPHPNILPPVANYSRAPIITRALLHQYVGHISDDLLDKLCRRQTLLGLPKIPPPRYDYDCPIFRFAKTTQANKGKTVNTSNPKPGELLHMDFVFWDVLSH
jgi:hypothetical protein